MAVSEEATDDAPVSGQPQYKSRAELEALSNAELGGYIAQSTYEFDGTSQAVRVALARLLMSK